MTEASEGSRSGIVFILSYTMKKPIFLILTGILIFSLSPLPKAIFLKKKERLNVILIVVDALRADHLGCYGYPRQTSPNIDKFAQEGVLFNRAFSQGARTLVAIPSVFTSLYPAVHRVLKLGAPLADGFITLPEILQDNGYLTAAFVGPQLEAIANFERRFQLFQVFEVTSEENDERIDTTLQITRQAVAWLKQNHAQPCFLYLHYFDVHPPYRPPAPYNQIFWQEEIDEEIKDFAINSITKNMHGNFLSTLNPQEQDKALAYIISQYDGAIRYVDGHIKILLEELEKLGLAKNTLVILTADHGEEFLEHGSFFHGRNLYDELTHIPLIMRLPEALPQGKVVADLARQIDILPTILDTLDIPAENVIQGVSLLPFLIKGEPSAKLASFSEGHFSEWKHPRGIRTEKWKFVEIYYPQKNSFSYELYDLKNDPQELNNLAEEKPQEAELFKTELKNYFASCAKIRNSLLGEGFVQKPVKLDERRKQRLKSLGYLH